MYQFVESKANLGSSILAAHVVKTKNDEGLEYYVTSFPGGRTKWAMFENTHYDENVKQFEDGDEEEAIERLNQLRQDIEDCKENKTDLKRQQSVYDTARTLLMDTGIKARIIKQYVPIMNKLINKYLAAMEFFVDFNLDEDFKETIRSRHRDVFSYASFSEGEKMRIDLALLFTWRAIAKLKNLSLIHI